jgi:hypothetical protein
MQIFQTLAHTIFITRKNEIDPILALLNASSTEHFNRAPDDVSRGGVVGLRAATWKDRRGCQRRFPLRRARSVANCVPPPYRVPPAGLGLVAAPDDRACFQELHRGRQTEQAF